MTDAPYHEQWHLSKAIPVSIIFFLIAQTVGIIIWATKLDSRVSFLETSQSSQDNRIDRIERAMAKLAVIEDRQINMARRVEIQTEKLNQLLAILSNTKISPTQQ